MPVDTTRGHRMAEAITSPSAVLLGAAGASALILGGAPLVAAGLVGVGAWAARVWSKLPKVEGPERIDLSSLRDPWRLFVRDAQEAQGRFQKAVATTEEGPLRERLASVGSRIDDAVRECYSIARRGQQLARAVRDLRADRIADDLEDVRARLRRSPGRPELEAAERSLREQLASAERLGGVARDAADKLTRINAELDEAVARAVELSLSVSGPTDVGALGTSVETIVGELESLRLALDEVGGARA